MTDTWSAVSPHWQRIGERQAHADLLMARAEREFDKLVENGLPEADALAQASVNLADTRALAAYRAEREAAKRVAEAIDDSASADDCGALSALTALLGWTETANDA